MNKITDVKADIKHRPIKVVQFGEGNFLRAFVDYMIDIANEKSDFNGNIAILKPISFGSLERFKAQNNVYTVVLRGKKNGKVIDESRIITSIEKAVDCETEYEDFMGLAKLPELRFVVSNTTEAGITLDRNDNFDGLPATPASLQSSFTPVLSILGVPPTRDLLCSLSSLLRTTAKSSRSAF